ncbi:MAG: vanomycin resistance protein VanB [Actinophytocola sp.]|nr:vanomycin resistance protein VanB [Actinophytocola sp.]
MMRSRMRVGPQLDFVRDPAMSESERDALSSENEPEVTPESSSSAESTDSAASEAPEVSESAEEPGESSKEPEVSNQPDEPDEPAEPDDSDEADEAAEPDDGAEPDDSDEADEADEPEESSAEEPITESPAAAEPAAESPRRLMRRRVVTIVAAIAGVFGALYALDLLVSAGEIPRDVTVAGVAIGGLDRTAAEKELRSGIEPRLAKQARITAAGADAVIDPDTARIAVDFDATLDDAGKTTFNPWRRLVAFFTDRPVAVVARGDDGALTSELGKFAERVDRPRVEGDIEFDGARPRAVEPVPGRNLDVSAGVAAVIAGWATGETIDLPIDDLPVKATTEGVRATLAGFAETAVSGPVTLEAHGRDLRMAPESIGRVLTFTPAVDGGLTPEVDVKRLRAELGKRLASTESKGKNARFAFGKKKAKVKPSVEGREVKWQATAGALLAAVKQSGERTAPVGYSRPAAKVTTAELKKLGVSEVVGEFTTGGFAPDSGVNIRRVAEEVNGAIVKPGKTFSLNKLTGPRGLKQDYVAAAVIENGELTRAVGGGISQFATTLYNAAYFAAMVDVEHREHSRYISRYPLAREATVFQNPDGTSVIDLKFRNDSPTAVVIQTHWTPSNITVRLWGTKRYKVESKTGERLGYTSAPTVTKPWGTSCTPQAGVAGYQATDTRIIRDLDGKEIEREKRTVTYRPQAEIKCAPPPEKPDDSDDDDDSEDSDDSDESDKKPSETPATGKPSR